MLSSGDNIGDPGRSLSSTSLTCPALKGHHHPRPKAWVLLTVLSSSWSGGRPCPPSFSRCSVCLPSVRAVSFPFRVSVCSPWLCEDPLLLLFPARTTDATSWLFCAVPPFGLLKLPLKERGFPCSGSAVFSSTSPFHSAARRDPPMGGPTDTAAPDSGVAFCSLPSAHETRAPA